MVVCCCELEKDNMVPTEHRLHCDHPGEQCRAVSDYHVQRQWDHH